MITVLVEINTAGRRSSGSSIFSECGFVYNPLVDFQPSKEWMAFHKLDSVEELLFVLGDMYL